MYVIKDEELGNFVSRNSIYIKDRVLYYSTFTGRHFGLDYYTKEKAELVLAKLQAILKKYKLHRKLSMIEVVLENLSEGERNKITYSI